MPIKSTNNPITGEDIRYNLDILAGKQHYPSGNRKLEAKDITPTALEFLEIFAEDIQSLEKTSIDKSVTDGLNHSLASVAGRIYDALEGRVIEKKSPSLFKDVQVPLVAKEPLSPSELASHYENGKVKNGLNKLPQDYKICRIKGDGHCLFRSIAMDVAMGCEKRL